MANKMMMMMVDHMLLTDGLVRMCLLFIVHL